MLSINLEKGQKLDLTKAVPSLKKIFVGAGWDMKKAGATMDADLSAVLLGVDGKTKSNKDFIYFGNKGVQGDAVWHSGDNLTGEGDGDDEVINVDLTKVPADVAKITFILTIYNAASKGQSLADLDNAFIRAVNAEGSAELSKFEVKGLEGDTINFCHLTRTTDGWEFNADGTTSSDFKKSLNNFGLAA